MIFWPFLIFFCLEKLNGYNITVNITIDSCGSLITDTGKMYSIHNDWREPQRFTLPGDTRSVTIKAHNPGYVGGILASFNNSVVTDESWECVDMGGCCHTSCNCRKSAVNCKRCQSSCVRENFKPAWETAVSYGRNEEQSIPWGKIYKIKSNAQWIWVADSKGTHVWCRKTFAPSSSSQPPTQTSENDTATSSLSRLPTSTTPHGKETPSLSHLPTSTTPHGKETPSLSHLQTSTTPQDEESATSSSRAACVGMSTTHVDNHRLEGFVFKRYHVTNIAKCGMKCFTEKGCRSFNFISSSMSCELNNSTERWGSENLKPAKGVTYFYRND